MCDPFAPRFPIDVLVTWALGRTEYPARECAFPSDACVLARDMRAERARALQASGPPGKRSLQTAEDIGRKAWMPGSVSAEGDERVRSHLRPLFCDHFDGVVEYSVRRRPRA